VSGHEGALSVQLSGAAMYALVRAVDQIQRSGLEF
jgi:hypothetical protein